MIYFFYNSKRMALTAFSLCTICFFRQGRRLDERDKHRLLLQKHVVESRKHRRFGFQFEYCSTSPAEKAMAPHSSALAWKIPWTNELGRLQSVRSRRVGHDWATSLSRIGEGNGNPLQCSCLENYWDRGAWWAAIYGVSQSWT